MRAVLFDRYGDYSELKLVTRDRPLPSAGEVLVRVTVAAVNPIDSTIRLGRFPAAKPPPLVLGQEACGVVVGGADSRLPEGTRVLVRDGFGTMRDGTWQEFVAARPEQLFTVSDRLDDAEVAASGSGYLAAALALKSAGFELGKTVLALGVGGAVGNAVYQLGRARGAARVIGTVGSHAKAALARSLGVEDVIDLSTESVADGVARLTGGAGVDIVVDPIGGAITGAALRSLADGGTLVALGYVAGTQAEINLQDMVRRRAQIHAVALGREPAMSVRALYDEMREEFSRSLIRPVVARTFPLDQAGEAQRFLDEERPFGKVVLKVAQEP
jgi:NADPH:quinone reductase